MLIHLYEDEPLAIAVVEAIRTGDLASLKRLLAEHPGLAAGRIVERSRHAGDDEPSRTLLHIAVDWPGHRPNVARTVAMLAEAGADVNARFIGARHAETPLHWAASCGDLEALDALLDAGADIEASGAVIAGGTPLDDAVAFAQWRAAHRLVERGAQPALWHAAALGLAEAVEAHFAGSPLPARYPWGAGAAAPPDEITVAFWCACHGGRLRIAQSLLERGAELNWAAVWDGLTPLDAAQRRGAADVVSWLRSIGAESAAERHRSS
jgi:ankyrin repeat protein